MVNLLHSGRKVNAVGQVRYERYEGVRPQVRLQGQRMCPFPAPIETEPNDLASSSHPTRTGKLACLGSNKEAPINVYNTCIILVLLLPTNSAR